MHDKYTTLFSLAPAGMSIVPMEACCILFDVNTNAIRELPPGRAITADIRKPTECLYKVSTAPFEVLFAVHNAILCTRPNGTEARPGMSLKLKFNYANSRGLQKLLLLYKSHTGRFPECITLEDIHTLLHDDIKDICGNVATAFSRSVTLPYAHWWNEIMYNTKYRDMLTTKLTQLFMSYGLLLDQDAFAINSLAPLTVA